MATVIYNGKTYHTDSNGCLTDFNEWDEEWTEYTKGLEGLGDLGDSHWAVINKVQEYFRNHGTPPLLSLLPQVTGLTLPQLYVLLLTARIVYRISGVPLASDCP